MGLITTIGPSNFENYILAGVYIKIYYKLIIASLTSFCFIFTLSIKPKALLSPPQSQWMFWWNTTSSKASSSLSFSLSSSLLLHHHHHRINKQEYLHKRQNPISTATNHRTNSSTSRKWRRLSWTRGNVISTVVFVTTTTTTTTAIVSVAVVFVTVPTTSRWWPRKTVTVLTVRYDRILSLLCFPKDSYLLPVHLLAITRTLIPLPLSSAIFLHNLRVLHKSDFKIL